MQLKLIKPTTEAYAYSAVEFYEDFKNKVVFEPLETPKNIFNISYACHLEVSFYQMSIFLCIPERMLLCV